MISPQEIGSSLVSFEMIFQALQYDLLRFKFHSPSPKILKTPGFNLSIYNVDHFELGSSSSLITSVKLLQLPH